MGYSYQQMMQQANLPQRGAEKPNNLSKEQILANAQLMTDGGMCLNSEGKKVGCNTLNQPVSVKPTSQEVKLQNLKVGDVLTAEDKFYEMFGIKYHNTNMFGVASRMKGRFYLAVVLVAGYFAYKKFKK